MKFTALTDKEITALKSLVDLSADKLDLLNKMIDGSYAYHVELSASDYCGFDVCIDEVVFERVSNETGDTLKSYSIKFDAEELTIEDDYEWNTDYDGGYGVYRALPKALRKHIETIVWLSAQIDAEQEHSDEETEEQSQELHVEADECYKPEELNYASKVDEASDSFAEVKLIKHARNVYYVEVVYYKEGAVTSKDTDAFNGYWDAVDRFHEYAQVIGAESQEWMF